jgi:hypothetical protein
MHRFFWIGISLLIAAAAVRLLTPFIVGIDLPSLRRVWSVNLVAFWALSIMGVASILWDLVRRVRHA